MPAAPTFVSPSFSSSAGRGEKRVNPSSRDRATLRAIHPEGMTDISGGRGAQRRHPRLGLRKNVLTPKWVQDGYVELLTIDKREQSLAGVGRSWNDPTGPHSVPQSIRRKTIESSYNSMRKQTPSC